MLKLQNIFKAYGNRVILNNVSYIFKPGILYVVIGASGSGKSTLLHIIAGIIKPDKGKVVLSNNALITDKRAIVLQNSFMFGDLSLEDNMLIPLLFKCKKSNEIKNISKLLKIDEILTRKASVCSGGEKARTNLARGILSADELLLVDEPTAHVDFLNAKIIVSALIEISFTKIVITTTHQPELFKSNNIVKLKIVSGRIYEI